MPAGPTYEPIATTTLSSAASTITFSSIPSTYTDLKLVLNVLTAGYDTYIRFNSDSAANYSWTWLRGNGSAASTSRATGQSSIFLGFDVAISPNPNLYALDIFSYAGSTNKTVLIIQSGDNNGSGTVEHRVGLWRSTSAITTVTLTHGGNFLSGTTATLYGIKAA